MASKNIVAKGTTYNGVESVTFPTSPSGTATFFEVSDTTATASDVLNSKYFYTAAGVKTQGTGTAPSPTLITKNITQNGTYDAEDDDADGYSSVTVSVSGGGGGGLVYETGTWTPSEDTTTNLAAFSFLNTHTTRPFHVLVEDVTDSLASDNSLLFWSAINVADAYGTIPSTGDENYYMRVQWGYKSSSGITLGGLNVVSESDLSGIISTSGFTARMSSTRYFRSSRTYKWIAVWAPTT